MDLRNDTALLLIDVVNPFDFPEAEALLAAIRPRVSSLRALVERFRSLQMPVVYVNDNFRRWRSDFREVVDFCRARAGSDVVSALAPSVGDYFVPKPHRSAFYGTPLELLLQSLEVSHVVIAGWATDLCVMASASDAQMRGYRTSLVADGTAAFSEARHERALTLLREGCNTALRTTHEVVLNPRIDGCALGGDS